MLSSRLAALSLALMFGMALTGCEEEVEDPKPIKLTGTSGDKVSLNGTWESACSLSGGSNSALESDEFSGTTIQVTRLEYLPDGGTPPDCSGDADILFELEVKMDRDVAEVSLSDWVDGAGAPAAAPAGLEGVTTSNGMTFTLTDGGMTPLTQAGVDGLNTEVRCDRTDWEIGVTFGGEAMLDCFLDGSSPELKESWVLDDTTSAAEHYLYSSPDEGTATDAAGFNTEMENYGPSMRQLD